MANTYYDSQLTAAEIEAALEAIDGIIVPANNGKVLAVENGTIVAKSVSEYTDVPVLVSKTITQNGTYDPASDSADGYDEVIVNVPTSQPILQSKSVTPSASQQTVQPDSGYDGLSSVVVAGDTDLIAGNIKKDVEIFGVTGTYEGSGGGGGDSYFRRLTPLHEDLNNGGYCSGNTWFVSGGDAVFTDVYQLENGERYLIMLGSTIDNRFRVAVFSSDVAETTSQLDGTAVNSVNYDSPYPYQTALPSHHPAIVQATTQLYLAIGKTNQDVTGIPTYVFKLLF